MPELGIGSEIAGYRIEEVVGRGGMGVVYRAIDDRLGRSVAVKAIAPEQAGDAEFRRRFIEESRAAAAIDHPNVLPVYEAGEEDGVLFLVTRLVEGADLAALLAQDGAMATVRALNLVGQVGAALDAAHAKGLVHRDVKPANVLVARDPGPGTEHCYLTDFGLAQRGDRRSRLTTAGQFVGTLDYTAPEQIKGEKVGPRADVYALAALFYECATGSPPLVRDSQPALLYAHLSDAPPPISSHLQDAPAALDEAVAKALSKQEEERFATCTEFVLAARAAVGDAQPAPPAQAGGSGRSAETVVAAAASGGETVRGETVRGASAGEETAVGHTRVRDSQPPPAAAARRRLWAIGAGAAAVLALAGLIGWLVLAAGGGDGNGNAVQGVRFSTESISLSREVSDDAGQLAETVQAGGTTAAFVDAFGRTGAKAGAIGDGVQRRLRPGDAGRADLRRGTRNLEEASAHLAVTAADPFDGRARTEAREAKLTMKRALTSLDRALSAQQRAFEAAGEDAAAASVQDSLSGLRASRAALVAPIESLLRTL